MLFNAVRNFYASQKSESTTQGSLFLVNLAQLVATHFTITVSFTDNSETTDNRFTVFWLY